MLGYATVMLSIELHYTEDLDLKDRKKMEDMRQEFHITLIGINDGDNFNKVFLDDLFDKIKNNNILRVIEDA